MVAVPVQTNGNLDYCSKWEVVAKIFIALKRSLCEMVVKGLLQMGVPPVMILIVLCTLWAENLPHHVEF